MHARTISAMAGCCFLTACAGAMKGSGAGPLNGLYEFSEHPAGVSDALSGRVRISPDSISIFESSPSCTQAMRLLQTEPFGFKCGDYGLLADRQTGHWKLLYTSSRTDVTMTTRCIFYEKTKDGKQVCTQTTTERHEHVTPVRGELRLMPLDVTAVGPQPQ
jgi:hypothetical protein